MKRLVLFLSCLLLIVIQVNTHLRTVEADNSVAAATQKPRKKQASVESPNDFGIKEVVPDEFRDRYERWKSELLATEFGRRQWDQYAGNKHFLLRIVVTGDNKFGARTDNYKWNDDGELVGATITLGKNLDKGFPDPVYYPVMNSLSAFNQPNEVGGAVLASTKLAHEFGHVDSTAAIGGKLYQQQEKLMLSYYKIFLSNGHDTRDPRLVQIAGELGRSPIDIWADREYWGEANALRYLAGRLGREYFYCSVLERVKRNVVDYAQNYEDRFDRIAETNLPPGCRY